MILRFINDDSFVGRAIDWVTNSLWDHVELQTPDGQWIGAHAGSGIQIRPADYCKPTREKRYALTSSPEAPFDEAAIMASAYADVGKKYNYLTCVGAFFHDRHWNQDGRYDCSQWVMDKTIVGGLWLLNCEPGFTYLITPELLHLSPRLMRHCVFSEGQ